MPSGADELHEQFDNDWNASTQLQTLGYRFDNYGLIHLPAGRTKEYPAETRALDYLFHEWDYGSSNRPLLLLECPIKRAWTTLCASKHV